MEFGYSEPQEIVTPLFGSRSNKEVGRESWEAEALFHYNYHKLGIKNNALIHSSSPLCAIRPHDLITLLHLLHKLLMISIIFLQLIKNITKNRYQRFDIIGFSR